MRLEVSGGRPRAGQRVRRVFELSPQAQAWLVERLRAEMPELARRLSSGQPSDLVVVGRRDELPVLTRFLDQHEAVLSPELVVLREAVVAAVEAERVAAAAGRPGRSR